MYNKKTMNKNRNDKDGSCMQIDKKACSRFVRLAKKKSIKVQNSSKDEDINDHIDYWLIKGDKKKSIDVKGLKRSSRQGASQWERLWIEYKNVKGNKGWLYGKQDFIAFECPNYFLVVKRQDLQDLCEKIAPFDINNITTNAEGAYRKIYSRTGRMDILTCISVYDIFDNIRYSIWEDNKRKWILRPYDKEKKFDCHPLLARLLSQRNVSPDKVKPFLEASYDSLSHPYALNGVEEAVEIFCKVALAKGTVAIFGDYDCDGVVSSTMLSELCKVFGLETKVFLPLRSKHGYGLSMKSVESFKEQLKNPTDLLIVTDCGISNYNEIEDLKKFGFKHIIIIDHHIVGDNISSNADALINWRLTKGYSEMCACGEVYQFIRGIRLKTAKINPIEFLTYAAIGTIGDVSPLNGDNRIIVRNGLKSYALSHVVSDGLSALIKQSRIYTDDLTQYHVAFKLVPQINATGRLSGPYLAYNLLVESDQTMAEFMAEGLAEKNEERKKLQKEIELEAIKMVEDNILEYKYGIIVNNPKWHIGIVGIVASKLTEKFNKPAIVLGELDGVCKGSGRSIDGINLKAILDTLPEGTLQKYGGHEAAVGVTLADKTPQEVNNIFNNACKNYYISNGFPPNYPYYDAELKISSLTLETARLLSNNLFPYSSENPEPVFLVSGATLCNTELKESDAWSLMTFSLKKGDDVSELKALIFNPAFGGEIENKKADVYFTFPQEAKEGKFGNPTLMVKDIQFLP